MLEYKIDPQEEKLGMTIYCNIDIKVADTISLHISILLAGAAAAERENTEYQAKSAETILNDAANVMPL